MQLLVGASRSNHLGSVKYIIDNAKNLDINVKESDRVKHSMHEIILLCLNIYIYLQHGWTALMWGTNKDNLEMVELLLANNADPNVRDKVYYAD